MTAPRYIQRELRAMDPRFFCIFNESTGRWEFRKWHLPPIFKPRFDNFENRSKLMLTVCVYDDQGHDVGFLPLDERAMTSFRAGLKNGENYKQFLQTVDEHNEKNARQANEEAEYVARYAAKKILQKLTMFARPQVFLGG